MTRGATTVAVPVLLGTRRLALRELAKTDFEAVHRYASDPAALRYLDWGPNTPAITREFLRQAVSHRLETPRHHVELAITLRTDGRLVGECSLNVSSPHIREAWIAYVLDPEFHGQGYATEAVRALVRFGLGRLKLHRIFATVHHKNAASARVLEKLGFAHEGRLRRQIPRAGRWHDAFLYALLNS